MNQRKSLQLLIALITLLGWNNNSYAQCEAVSANITTVSGESAIFTCPSDGNSDVIQFMQEGANSDLNFQYVATDSEFNVLGLPPSNEIDFEGAGEGVCYVWGFNYEGNVLLEMGQNIFSSRLADGCYQLSRTAVKVVRSMTDGGTVAMPDGATERTVCTTDGYGDVVKFRHETTSNAAYRYIITDDQNNILGLPPSDNLNFEGVPAGVCRVWGLSYNGNITAAVGDNAATTALTDACFDLSDNFITITRTDVDGGTVATENGETMINTVAGDGVSDLITFTHESSSDATFIYIVTDENNKIIGLPNGNSLDFEGAGAGVCRVWGVSYTGDLRYLLGGTVGDFALSSDCFDVSENFIEVVRSANDACALEGGKIAIDAASVANPINLSTDNTALTICAGDGVSDAFEVTLEGNDGASAWVITDSEGTILALPPSPPFDLEGAGAGTCLIWHLSFEEGNFDGAALGNNALEDLTGCYNLSNAITVDRQSVDGGVVTTTDGATEIDVTVGDGVADVVAFATTDASGGNFAYVVTDENGIILGLPPANEVDFESAGEGTCLVWGLSYTGELLATMGDNALEITLSNACFDLSDEAVRVVRTSGGQNINNQLIVDNRSVVEKIEVFPNPTTNLINFQLNIEKVANTEAQINVYNIYGQLLQTTNVNVALGFNQFELETANFTNGNYFLELRTDNKIYKSLFVKQ